MHQQSLTFKERSFCSALKFSVSIPNSVHYSSIPNSPLLCLQAFFLPKRRNKVTQVNRLTFQFNAMKRNEMK